MRKQCSIPDCTALSIARTWCSSHYYRWRRRASPSEMRSFRHSCEIVDCTGKHYARGWCSLHYSRWLNHSSPNWLPRIRGICTIADCKKLQASKGWCNLHYGRGKRQGSPLTVIRPSPTGPAAIARTLGLTRQRVHQMQNPEKHQARVAVGKALRNGALIKPERCELCNENKRLQGHHADYDKPLTVDWLCADCHNTVHPHPPRFC